MTVDRSSPLPCRRRASSPAGIAVACAAAATLAVATDPTSVGAQQILTRAETQWDVSRVPDSVARDIDFVFRHWDRANSPGAAVGIVSGGELVYARGYGMADLEHEVPITPRTVFHVASISKQFTAFAVGLLAERGRLSLDDDVRKHVPELPDLGHRITLRHLIHHTSGIRDQWTLLTLAGWRLDDVITRADILGLLTRQRELNFEPGTEFVYSNSGYMLLAEVVDRVTGRSFRKWTSANVFEPLRMDETHAHDDHRMIVENRADSYARLPGGGHRRAPLNYATVGATSLFTTVEDLARWAANLLDPGFAAEVVASMVRPVTLVNGSRVDYGFGLGIGKVDGRRVYQHGGADAGFRSHFAVFPDEAVAVIVLANDAELDASRLAHRAATAFLKAGGPIDISNEVSSVAVPAPEGERTPGAEPAPGAAPEPGPNPVRIARSDLEPMLGYYWSPGPDYVRRIRLADGGLRYDRGAGDASRLEYLGGSLFRMVDTEAAIHVRFERSAGLPDTVAHTDVMVVFAEGDPPLRFQRIDSAPDPLPADDYTGLFVSEEVGVGVQVLRKNGGVALRHPRHGTIELRPLARDRFDSGQWWLGRIRFTRGPDGEVDGFRSSSGRVRNLEFRRVETERRPGRFGPPVPPLR